MRDRSDRYRVQTIPTFKGIKKRLGSYLVESGLLTTAQLDVALNDQKMTEESTGTHMQLGEIIAARGWVKEQTIEYLMQKVVIPERRQIDQKQQETVRQDQTTVQQQRTGVQQQRIGVQQRPPQAKPSQLAEPSKPSSADVPGVEQSFVRREVPISKPLPPVKSGDSDVNWVG